jgi:hypothetical protein
MKWIFNFWNSQGRHASSTDGRTFKSTPFCLVGREQDENDCVSYEANINPNIHQNCTRSLLVCSLKLPHVFGVRIPAMAKDISVIQNCLWGPPSPLFNGYRCSSRRGNASGAWSWWLTSTQRPVSENSCTYNPPRYLHSVATDNSAFIRTLVWEF